MREACESAHAPRIPQRLMVGCTALHLCPESCRSMLAARTSLEVRGRSFTSACRSHGARTKGEEQAALCRSLLSRSSSSSSPAEPPAKAAHETTSWRHAFFDDWTCKSWLMRWEAIMTQFAPGSLLLSQLGIQLCGCSVSVENALDLVKLLYRMAEILLLACIDARVEIILSRSPCLVGY